MKIEPTGPSSRGFEPERLSERSNGRAVDAPAPAAVQDDSQFSSVVQKLVKDSAQLPDIRQERVASLRETILQDRYHVSNSAVADAMFNTFFAKGH
ncbi:MAG: flagellar biosynthesis anti-sigma factor FlgM [Acidobacteriia bacterium]|nr:flagellar biosynthesis anti-sigma factor FlgM [Terriglobia bacterium]